MTLRIGKPYRGRFHAKAVDLVKNKGQRVGMMWVGPTDDDLLCHVCRNRFPKPELDPVHNDAWGECPHCKLPFVFSGA